jgi:DNA helicase-2/ATP-dependent DNA helicase PcrA
VDILSDLNESQRRAVTHLEGPLLVLAGAGSGKTRVITRRIAYLASQGIDPRGILAITFTNKAAGEMKQRVEALGLPRGAVVGTFHSVCARILREFAAQANLPPNFIIYDADDQLALVRQAMKRLELPTEQLPPGRIHAAISRAKNKLQDEAGFAGAAEGFAQRKIAQVYQLYQRMLAENQAVDFDDLLLRAVLLMRDHPEVRQLLGRRWRYVLVDEYQDTNHAQYVLAHGIALEHENIAVTGDPDQSIYAWRGADLRNILEFEADYPNAVVIRLEQNYRSLAPILSAASSLIAHNSQRKEKDLVATRPGAHDVQVLRLLDEHAEAAEVANLALRLRQEERLRYSDIAVFYRVNALSRVLEEAFRQRGIPYQIARGVEFYNRREIKDVLAYLRLLVNPADNVSCQRVINVPARGIGAVTLERLEKFAQSRGISLLQACRDGAAAGLSQGAASKAAAFAAVLAELSAQIDKPVAGIVEAVLKRSGLEEFLKSADDQRQALKNVEELVSTAAEFDRANPGSSLAEFLHQVSLVSDVDSIDPQAGAVTFMTLHAAKGLEFPAVVIVGCEQGLLPLGRDDGDADLEEERRLAFVGMTRARDRLVLTSAKYRMLRGHTQRRTESQFLGEIGGDSVVRMDKAGDDQRPRQPGVPVDQFNQLRYDSREESDADQRAMIEAMEQADLLPDRFSAFAPGRRVRSPIFGGGFVRSVSFNGEYTRATVDFDRAGRKTLILEYAPLEAI